MNVAIYIGIGLVVVILLLRILNTSSNGQKKFLDTSNWRDKDLIKYYHRYKNVADKSQLAPDNQGEAFFASIVEEIDKRELMK